MPLMGPSTGSHRSHRKRIKEQKKEIQEEFEKKLRDMPQEYPYYCKRCLYQSKQPLRRCPECGGEITAIEGYSLPKGPGSSSLEVSASSQRRPSSAGARSRTRSQLGTSSTKIRRAIDHGQRSRAMVATEPSSIYDEEDEERHTPTAYESETVCSLCAARDADLIHSCGAAFCMGCLRRWYSRLPEDMKRKRLCPDCRRKLEIGIELQLY